jgi:hypothetical protein
LGSGVAYHVLFRPMQGTGNRNDYEIPQIPESWTPRKKQGLAELFLSVGTWDGNWHDGVNSLTAMTINPKYAPYKHLTHPTLRDGLIKERTGWVTERLSMTYDKAEGYGNPHAVVWAEKDLAERPLVQVGSFLEFGMEDEGLEMIRERLRV